MTRSPQASSFPAADQVDAGELAPSSARAADQVAADQVAADQVAADQVAAGELGPGADLVDAGEQVI